MLYVSNVANWKTGILGCNGILVMVTIGKSFGGAEGVADGGMVHGTSPLTVFLVFQI